MAVLRLVRRHIALVLACALLGTALAVATAILLVTPSYRATTSLYVSARGTSADDRLQNGEYARTHVSSYADMVDSDDILDAVRARLAVTPNMAGGYADLADNIAASNPLETALIDITVEDSSPQQALLVARAIGEVYDPVVAQMEGAVPAQSPVRITVLTAPILPTSPHSPSKTIYAASGLLLGLVVGTGAAWLLEALPRRQRGRRQQEPREDWWSWELDQHAATPQPVASNGTAVKPFRGDATHGPGPAAKEPLDAGSPQRDTAR